MIHDNKCTTCETNQKCPLEITGYQRFCTTDLRNIILGAIEHTRNNEENKNPDFKFSSDLNFHRISATLNTAINAHRNFLISPREKRTAFAWRHSVECHCEPIPETLFESTDINSFLNKVSNNARKYVYRPSKSR